MKLSKIMSAVATVAALGSLSSAMAAPLPSRIAITAGASATRANLILAMTNLCTAAGGVTSSLGSGNFRSLVCADSAVTTGAAGTYVSKANTAFKNFQGTNFAELRVNTEGSFSAVLILNGNTPAVFDPAANASSSTYPAGSVIVGGLLDLEPTAFPAATIGANSLFPTTPVGIAQTFGVAVSSALYNAMFADQQAAGLLPATCTTASTTLPYCVPSIGIAQMATIMADNPFNSAYANGVSFLAPSASGELRYVRRVNNSGTQAAAQNYFLGLPCSANGLSIVAEPTTDDEVGGLKDASLGGIRVLAAPGTGDVLAELNKAGLYAIGVVSGENAPTAAVGWRWLRVNGAHMAEDAEPVGNLNVATMKNGSYNFYFESVYMGGSAAGDAFWGTVSTALNSLAAPAGLINSADLSAGYNKGGLACQGSASN